MKIIQFLNFCQSTDVWVKYLKLAPSQESDVGAAESAAAAAWGSISLGGGGVSAAGTHFLAT